MHQSRLLLIVISFLGMVTSFLPWQTISMLGDKLDTKGTDTSIAFATTQIGDGWFILISFLMALILAVTGKRNVAPGFMKRGVTLLLSAFCIYITAFDSAHMKSTASELGSGPLAMQSSPGYGLYGAMALAVLLTILSFIPFKKEQA